MMRPTRQIRGELFGARGKQPKGEDGLFVPPICASTDPRVEAVRVAPSTTDAQVEVKSFYLSEHKRGPRRFRSAPCPACGYQSDERTAEGARLAYVHHRAQERMAPRQSELFSGRFDGELKPYSDGEEWI